MILEHIWFEPFVYVGSVTGAGGGGRSCTGAVVIGKIKS